MKDKVTMDLKELAGGEVEISYNIDVSMVGKLAMFGDRVMRSKAVEIEREFVKNLSAKLSSVA
jgi:carbon monoxide dehydrogenase subunit G